MDFMHKKDKIQSNEMIRNNFGVGDSSRERIGYIDALKGFAILCVVLGHVADGYLDGNSFPESSYMIYCIYNVIYAFHMPLFMMISGFVYYTAYFNDSGLPDQKRIRRQALNLVAVYFIFSIPFGLFKAALGGLVNKGVTVTDVLLVWAKPITPYWYLYALIGLYLIFSIKKIHLTDERICLAATLFVALVSPLINFKYFELRNIAYYCTFFYIGMLYRKNKSLSCKWMIAAIFAGSVALLALFWNKAYKLEISIGYLPVIKLFVAIGVILSVWFVFENVSFLSNNSLLQLCGRYSLEIYVIHCVFTAGFRVIFPKIGITNVYISIILNLIISTTIPILFSMLCKKLKIHGLLFKPVTYIINLKEKKNNVNKAG